MLPSLFESNKDKSDLVDLKQASSWASKFLKREITPANISYLVQYGRVKKYVVERATYVSLADLAHYYQDQVDSKESEWKSKLGQDLNWRLSFDSLREKDTTKHVHRLHPYKGKFIPQLVEYFLDQKTDKYKKEVFFCEGDIVLDPFCGSGTTLVQANEMGIHAIGLDVSVFNTLIANVKTSKHNIVKLSSEIDRISSLFFQHGIDECNVKFELELSDVLKGFNKLHYPSPEFKRLIRTGKIDEKAYSVDREKEILSIYNDLISKYQVKIQNDNFTDTREYLCKWCLAPVLSEIDFLFTQIEKVNCLNTRKVLEVILSRTVRSCRATRHSDLATLKKPVTAPYYCRKHGKICKPLFSVRSWWKRYSQDTLTRLHSFDRIRTHTYQHCLQGDSRNVDIVNALGSKHKQFKDLIHDRGIQGIFTSPPYVGLIDYHEQHAYAYELFNYPRSDEKEIGPLSQGQGMMARKTYVESISTVLLNCKKYFSDNYNVFLVANDKYELYPEIAKLAGMEILNKYKRPVLNRTEKDKAAYSETIFHMR